MYLMIMTFLVITVIAAAIIIMWSAASGINDTPNQLDAELKIVDEVMINDSYLHRLLMIEIVADRNKNSKSDLSIDKDFTNSIPESIDSISTHKNQESSNIVTFNQMKIGMHLLGKSLVRSLGNVIAQRVAILMQTRNETLRIYYESMHNVICENGICAHVIEMRPENTPNSNIDSIENVVSNSEDETDDSIVIQHQKYPDSYLDSDLSTKRQNPETISNAKRFVSPLFQTYQTDPSIDIARIFSGAVNSEIADITSSTIRKLERLDREITDAIAASFHIRDSNANKNESCKRPVVHHERLYNLLSMYDKELINQAKLYVSQQFNRSMSCTQSTLEIANQIGNELNLIMKESQNLINQTPGRIFDSIIA
jgi:hypothetical protein